MKAFILSALFFVAANAGRAAHAVARSDGKGVTWQGQGNKESSRNVEFKRVVLSFGKFGKFAKYVVGPANSSCENGMIKKLSECKQVAKQLNNDFGDEEEVSDYPGGCYVWTDPDTDDTVYFNNNFAGASEEKSLPICGTVLTTEATLVETASTDYVVGKNYTTCENGMIDNLAECEKATKQLNIDFGEIVIESSHRPGGCFIYYYSGCVDNLCSDYAMNWNVYFNKNFPGAEFVEAMPICGQGTCSDGIKNQGEEEIDCGGPYCPSCLSTALNATIENKIQIEKIWKIVNGTT